MKSSFKCIETLRATSLRQTDECSRLVARVEIRVRQFFERICKILISLALRPRRPLLGLQNINNKGFRGKILRNKELAVPEWRDRLFEASRSDFPAIARMHSVWAFCE